MKKHTEILEDIKVVSEAIRNAEAEQKAEIDRWFALFDAPTMKESMAKKKAISALESEEHMKKATELEATIKNGKIKVALMRNNARIALFHEALPVVLEVLKKYEGKPFGEKTRGKVFTEIWEKTGYYVSISCDSVCINNNNCWYDVKCEPKWLPEGKRKHLLVNNKVQCLQMEDFEVVGINKNYIEDLDSAVEEIKRLHKLALEKEQELIEICHKYNDLATDGISSLSYGRYLTSYIV